MQAWFILPIILGYAFLMSFLKVTKFSPKNDWQKSLKDIFTIALPVAIGEEFIFRYLIMFQLLIRYFGLPVQLAVVYSALFFSLTHFLWGMYRNGSEHQTPAELSCLVVGLFLFGMVTGKLFFFAYSNIVWHCMAIYAVQLTTALFTNEEERYWYIWDNGHQLVRTIPIWLLMGWWYIW